LLEEEDGETSAISKGRISIVERCRGDNSTTIVVRAEFYTREICRGSKWTIEPEVTGDSTTRLKVVSSERGTSVTLQVCSGIDSLE
jgi:hypothetical protein